MKYNFESSQSSQLALLIDFVRQNSEFYDQFDSSRIDLNGKNRIDKGRKQILFCKTSAKGFISANLFDIRTNETKHFSGFEALKDDNFYSAPKFYKSVPLKPVVEETAASVDLDNQIKQGKKKADARARCFNEALATFLTLDPVTPDSANLTPYFGQALKKHIPHDICLLDVRVAFYSKTSYRFYKNQFNNCEKVAVLPLKNLNGEIQALQLFSDNKIFGKEGAKRNKTLVTGSQPKNAYVSIGCELQKSSRQFITEGVSSGLSFKNIKEIDFNVETDCLIIAGNSGNIKNICSHELLKNVFFVADNDVIDSLSFHKKNTGLLTAIESSFLVSRGGVSCIYIPTLDNQKCDFYDTNNFQLLNAKEVFAKFSVYSQEKREKLSLGLNEEIYFKTETQEGVLFAPILVKDFIKKYLENSEKKYLENGENLPVQLNRKNKTFNCELICNGKDFFLSATSISFVENEEIKEKESELDLFFFPLEKYLSKKIRKGQTTYFLELNEESNLELNNRVNNQIESFVPNLMKVDYRGAKEMIVDKDNLESGKYLPTYLARLDFPTMFLPTPMGSGKTHLFGEGISCARECNPNASILLINPLVSLVANSAQRLELTKYSDKEGGETNTLVTTLHSLPKHIERFENETGVVILDEVNHILSLFNSTILKCNTTDLFNRFKKLIRNAKKLYVADAYLSQQTIDFIAELRDMNDAIVIKYDFVETHNKSFQLFEHDSSLDNEVLAAIENNRNVGVVCSSANKSKVIGDEISLNYPTKKLLIINSETTDNIDVKNFLNNPNEEIRNYDAIIYSPAISGGVSFDDLKLTPDFEIFGYFNSFVHTANDFMQMLGRFRRKSAIKLHINSGSSSASIKSNLGLLNEANKSNHLILIESLESTYSGSDNEFIRHAVEALKKEIERGLSPLDSFVSKLKKAEAIQKEYARPILIKLLENAGYKNAGVVSGKNEGAALLSQEAKEAVINKEIDCIQKAQPIDEIEYSGLRKKHKRSTKEAFQIKRFKIENHFKLDLTCENIKFVLTREIEVAMAYKLTAWAHSNETMLKKALSEIDYESDSYIPISLRKFQLLTREVLTQVFGALNIKLNADGFDVDNSKPVTVESLSGVFEWIKQRNRQITAAGFKSLPTHINLQIKWITNLLKGFGLRIDKETKKLKIAEPLIGKIAANLAQKTR